MLEKAQKNIQAGLSNLDEVVGTRTRAIQRQLRKVETLPAAELKDILPELPLESSERNKTSLVILIRPKKNGII